MFPFIKFIANSSVPLSAYRARLSCWNSGRVGAPRVRTGWRNCSSGATLIPDWQDRVEVITLSIDEKADEARGHLEIKGWSKTFNVWAGEGAWQASAPKAFRVRGIPTTYVLDREGRIVKAGHPASMNLGQIVEQELRRSAQ